MNIADRAKTRKRYVIEEKSSVRANGNTALDINGSTKSYSKLDAENISLRFATILSFSVCVIFSLFRSVDSMKQLNSSWIIV